MDADLTETMIEVGDLADRLCEGYYAHHATIQIAASPAARVAIPPKLPDQLVPIGEIRQEDGKQAIRYDFELYLEKAPEPVVAREYGRVWLSGALIMLNDALTQHGHFDRQPEYELIRHLRDAVAHGNRFKIDHPEQLDRYPAYMPGRNPDGTSNHDQRRFEIAPDLDGQSCLFDFVGEAEVPAIFQGVAHRLHFNAAKQ